MREQEFPITANYRVTSTRDEGNFHLCSSQNFQQSCSNAAVTLEWKLYNLQFAVDCESSSDCKKIKIKMNMKITAVDRADKMKESKVGRIEILIKLKLTCFAYGNIGWHDDDHIILIV